VIAVFIREIEASAENVAKMRTRRSAAIADFLIWPGLIQINCGAGIYDMDAAFRICYAQLGGVTAIKRTRTGNDEL